MSSPATKPIFGADPLDSGIALTRPAARRKKSWWLRDRMALGLSATPAPGVLLVVGLALGPDGLNLLSRSVLTSIEPAVSAALAALGLLLGLGVDLRWQRERRLLGAASIEAGLTVVLVAGGILLALPSSPAAVIAPWLMAGILGVCAAASSTSPAESRAALGTISSRVADLDDVLPIAVGGLLLALARTQTAGMALWLTLECVLLALAVAFAGWLLLDRAASVAERYVYTAGIVLMLSGFADFLGMSALLFGLSGGLLLSTIRGSARDRVAEGARYVQHPLLVLLLLVAGARVVFTPAVFVAVLVYVTLRLAGKAAGAALVGRLSGAPPAHLGRILISPGVVAVAFALNVGRAGADPAGFVLAVAVAGAVFTEIIALVAAAREAK